jgi:hypothetical protein
MENINYKKTAVLQHKPLGFGDLKILLLNAAAAFRRCNNVGP